MKRKSPAANSMMMPSRPMDVAVGEFFLRGVADVDDIDIELQRHAGQGMVGIDLHRVILYGDHGDDLRARPAGGLGAELHARAKLRDALEQPAGDVLDELFIPRA